MNEAEVTRPDRRTFKEHLERGSFLYGVAQGKWRLISAAWPKAIIEVSAAPRPNAPTNYTFQFDLQGYPQQAPTARLWDAGRGASASADRWPTGSLRFSKAFRVDWNAGSALYLPCDRVAMQGHPGWQNQHPHLWWTADKDISFFLEIVHELLNSSSYSGARSPST